MSGTQSFWARRRAGVAAEAEAEAVALQEKDVAEAQAALEEQSDEEILAALDLPDPETLKKGDDFSVFMAKAVPDRIRRKALRTLWRSNPVLANVDMLVDYGEDFTDSATVIENLQTTYQVGKGMLKHVEEMARQAAERENPTEPPEEIDVEDDEDVLIAQVDEDEMTLEAEADQLAPVEAEEEVYATPAPRRMKFRLEETA